MRRRIQSFILAVGLLLTMMPDTAMAARMERDAAAVQESGEQENMAETGESDMDVTVPGAPLGLEGSGTTADPYRIKDAEQLRIFADMVNGAGSAPNTGLCAVLTQNIDLSGVCSADIGSWTPIGADPHPYTGIFDGGSFAVSGLYCHKANSSCVGLFGYNAGTIKNLGVVGADIDASSYTGGVCGYNQGIITGCYNTSTVSGESSTGGVCGYNDGGGTVSGCYNTGAVSGSQYVGGICGYNKNVTSNSYNMGKVISNSYNVGTVTGGMYVGGICGYNKKLVSGCYNTGEVGGKDYVGSVCGYNHPECTIRNCYYLITGTEKGNYGAAMTRQQFASGEVCWLLNDGKSENVIWHQTCGAGFPAFGGKTVYQMQTYKQNGNTKEVVVAYTNDKNKKGISQAASAAPANSDNNSGETTGENMDGHVYQEPEWKWKEYKSATAVFTCQDCGEQLNLKAKISKKEKKATCVVDGETVYTASVERDGENYEDKKKIISEKLPHQPLVWVNQSEATCETPGYKDGCYTCTACEKCYKDVEGKEEYKQVRIPALGHKYEGEPQWTPNSDYSSVTAEFVCARCGKSPDPITVKTKVVSTDATCMIAGTTKYSAVVKFKNKSYYYEESVQGQTLPHNYGGKPVWNWPSVDDPASAVFSCLNKDCNASISLLATIDIFEVKGTDCKTPGKIIYTATAKYEGETYTTTKEKELLPQHNVVDKIPPKAATCGEDGNVEYWQCSVCGQTFADQAGTLPITDVILPATKDHVFQHVRDNIYKCDVCGGTYIVTESGTKSIYSLEEDVSPQNEKESDNVVSPFVPDGTEQNEAESDEDETSLQPEAEEKQEDSVTEGADESCRQENRDIEGSQNGQDGENVEGSRMEQEEQAGKDGSNEQQESGDGIIDVQENAARYGIIYPEGEEAGNGIVTEGAVEGNAVNLRADTSGDDAVQAVRGQQELSLWGSAAALSLLVGIILCFVLKKENN